MRRSHTMRRCSAYRVAAVGAIAWLAGSFPVMAATYTLSADQDAWIREANPSENHGTDTELSAKGTSSDEMRAVYRFDLSSIPATATVTSATLSLWVSSKDDSGNALDIHRVTADWTETGVSWNNTAADFDPTAIASFTAPNDDEFVNTDITALLQSWICGEYSEHGIVVHSNSSNEAKFTSKEWSSASERPKLTVVTSSDTGGCSAGVDHFSISHDASATACIVENITIAQHNSDHTVDASYAGTITLSTSTSNGDWSLVTGSGTLTNSGSGNATYSYVGGDNGSVVLGLLNPYGETLNIDVTDGSGSDDASEDSSLRFSVPGAVTFRDEFDSVSYSGNNGTNNWATDWLEINENNGPSSGDEQVVSDQSSNRIRVRDNDSGGEGVQRELDLSAYISATLSFIYRRNGLDSSSDYVTVDVSRDGGSSWTELDRLTGFATDAIYLSASYDISAFIASNTRIRFLGSSGLGSSDIVYFDDVEISANAGSSCAPSPTPVGEWRMDEQSWGGTPSEVADNTGNDHDGTATGAATSGSDPAIAGDPGTCRYGSFDGSSDYLQIPHDAALNGSSALTYMAWIQPQSWSGTRQVMAKSVHGGGSGRAQMGIFAENNVLKARAETNSGRWETSATLPTLNVWSHVAAVFNGTSVILYLDGISVGTVSFASTTLVTNTDALNIGKRVGTSQYFFDGDIDEVRVYSSALSIADVRNAMAETHPCSASGINHFAINHDGSGINCQAEPVTLSAHDAGHGTVTGYTGVATLSTTTSNGDWSLLSGAGTLINSGNGAGSYAFNSSDSGTAVLGLKNTFAETTNINVTDGGAVETASEDANLVYASAGFNFLANSSNNAIATQIGGKSSNVAPGFQTLELEAVKTSDDTGACEAALVGVNTVDLAFECENPGLCSVRQVAINGTNIAANPNGSVSSFTGIGLDFGDDTDTTATFTLSYPDVGQLQLHARRTLSPSGELMLGGSNSFVVRPFALQVSAAGNPAATSSAGPAFTSAGTNFASTVTAVLWEANDDMDSNGIADNHNDTIPNNNADLSNNVIAISYGQESAVESVLLTALLDQPAGGSDPGLAGSTTITSFTAGSGTSSAVRYDEVGIIEMAAAIGDGDYLGIGAPATAAVVGKSGNVGRFNPARYAVTTSFITAACSSVFTYARQTFAGTMTLQAQNGLAGGYSRTANYLGAFVTLDPSSELIVINDQTGGSYDLQTIGFSQDFDSGTAGEAVLALQLRWDMSEQAPVTSTIQLMGITDEVTVISSAPVDIGFTTMRYGRIALRGALGSELVNLAVPMRAEYFFNASTGFVKNTDDACSSAVTLSFGNFAGSLNAGDTCVLDTGSPGISAAGCAAPGPSGQRYTAPPTSGDFNLVLQAPGTGNDGSVTVDADVPAWLRYDWDAGSGGSENPSARATFGIYRGGDRQIFRRELY